MSNYKVGSYIRLSRDESYSNSDSMDNQIKMTDFYCEENKLEVIDKYIDNGYSRTTFDRNFEKKVITNDLLTITVDELKQMVEEHKYLMIILELIIQLSEKYFYETVCEFIKKLLNEFELNINE